MPPASAARLTPPHVLDRLLTRIEKCIDALKRAKLAGYEVAIAELETEHNLLLRARRYLAAKLVGTTARVDWSCQRRAQLINGT